MNQYFTPSVKRGAIYFGIIVAVLGVISALTQAIDRVIPFLTCITVPIYCLVGLLVPIAIGWFVAQWGSATDMGKGVIDGAIACGVGGLVGGVITFLAHLCFRPVFSVIGLSTQREVFGALILGLIVGLGEWIIGAIVAAIFGAVGGLLYVAIQGNKAKPAPAA